MVDDCFVVEDGCYVFWFVVGDGDIGVCYMWYGIVWVNVWQNEIVGGSLVVWVEIVVWVFYEDEIFLGGGWLQVQVYVVEGVWQEVVEDLGFWIVVCFDIEFVGLVWVGVEIILDVVCVYGFFIDRRVEVFVGFRIGGIDGKFGICDWKIGCCVVFVVGDYVGQNWVFFCDDGMCVSFFVGDCLIDDFEGEFGIGGFVVVGIGNDVVVGVFQFL